MSTILTATSQVFLTFLPSSHKVQWWWYAAAPAVHVFRPENRRTGEPEDRSGADRAERTPTTESIGGIPLPNQIRAETPGMHQTKPHPRSSPHSSKWRRCRDTRSVQDEDRGQGCLRIDRNSYLEVQDWPGSQRSGRTNWWRRKWSQRSWVPGGTPTSIVSHPGARTDPETTGASFPVVISILSGTRTSSKAWSKAYKSEANDPRIWAVVFTRKVKSKHCSYNTLLFLEVTKARAFLTITFLKW